MKAGNDVKMPTGSPETLKNAFEKGFITRDELLRSAERLMNLVMKVNTFHDKIADPITVDIGADTTFKAAENILWSETVKAEGTSDGDGGKILVTVTQALGRNTVSTLGQRANITSLHVFQRRRI
ncbi:MAG: hypothetical protein ACLVJ6_16210 [Merdibacter sp.]